MNKFHNDRAPFVVRGLYAGCRSCLGCLGLTDQLHTAPFSVHRRLKILFGLAGLPPAAELHGDMTQAARLESLEKFRKVGADCSVL